MKLSLSAILMLIMLALLSGCAPTIKVVAPDKPITINLNVKIEHEIRIKIDKELDEIINDDDIF
ncbi:MAG: YnbE family lipoprotein [Alteromonadaceae bacterium]|nr:YnbE family lipoprotein [Alteromonadaceae bacterium]